MSRIPSWSHLILAALLLGGCRHAPPTEAGARATAPLAELERYLTGSFSSAAQSREDPRVHDIRLRMRRIWTERRDGPWLYVEQAAAERQDTPYRQRIYRLRALEDGRLESQVFLLPGDALRYAGAWHKPELLAEVSPEQLTPREGCSIFLTAEGQPRVFRGSTPGTSCPSDLRGAAHATSEVTLREEGLLTLDRGYDAQGRQVWGSQHGPYRFDRVTQ